MAEFKSLRMELDGMQDLTTICKFRSIPSVLL